MEETGHGRFRGENTEAMGGRRADGAWEGRGDEKAGATAWRRADWAWERRGDEKAGAKGGRIGTIRQAVPATCSIPHLLSFFGNERSAGGASCPLGVCRSALLFGLQHCCRRCALGFRRLFRRSTLPSSSLLPSSWARLQECSPPPWASLQGVPSCSSPLFQQGWPPALLAPFLPSTTLC